MTKQTLPGLLLLALAMALPAVAADKPAGKPAAKTTHAPAKSAEPKVLEPVVVSPEQMAIANRVLVGKINCELGAVVLMTNDEHSPGRFFLDMGNKRYAMLPVVTSTGAVRLEEESSGAVWIQLGNKSMLMNQKEGKRLADDCMNPDQLLVAQALERNPQPGLLDAPKDALVPIGAGGKVQELVPNPEPPPKAKGKKKSK
ncbi:MAG: hypothetical protein V4627_08840 [Pseudomonadota bacterium]